MPWVIHFSGKIAAISCIHAGSSEKTKNTPEMNCSTIAIGEMIAGAVRPFLTKRGDRDAEQRAGGQTPSTATQSVGQPALAVVGRSRS